MAGAMDKMKGVNAVKAHQILSCVHAFFQWNYAATGYTVSDITSQENGSYIVTAVNRDVSSEILKILKLLVIRDFDDLRMEDIEGAFMRDEPEQAGRNVLIERIIAGSENADAFKGKEKESLVPLSVWSVDCNGGRISKVSGNSMDRDLDAVLASGHQNTFFNYPVPYVKGMEPVIALSFLTLNFTVRGWQSSLRILNDAHRLAMKYSPDVESDRVLEELTAVLKVCVRVGLFSEKGDKVYLPRARERSEISFTRKYREYLEKTMKHTLYDYGSTL